MRGVKQYCQYWQARIAKRFRLRSLKISRSVIARWFMSPLGLQVLLEEQQVLDSVLPEMFGYHLMQLSVLPDTILHHQSPTGHQFRIEPVCRNGIKHSHRTHASYTVADFEHLPVDMEVIDVAIIHHALEYSTHPHQLLREVTRTLIPNGHIVLIGFNPYSLLGLRHAVGRLFSRSLVYRRQRLPVSRLRDWFEVLDLEIVHSQSCAFGLPFHRYCSNRRLNRWLQYVLPFWGGCYVLVLRKNITPMTMIKSSWKKQSVLPSWRKGVAAQTHQNSYLPTRQSREKSHEKN
ncbi:class I SAM-dependent methyltransferase [Eionea flava]